MLTLIGLILVIILITKLCFSALSWTGGVIGNACTFIAKVTWIVFKWCVIIAIPLTIIGYLFF